MSNTTKKSNKVTVFILLGLLVGVVGILIFTSGGAILFHGNVASEGYKQGYIFSVSHKPDKIGKIYKLELSSLGWGEGLHADKSGQPINGGKWAVNWLDDEEGKVLYQALTQIPPDTIVRCWYVEHDQTMKGSTNYRLKKVEWVDSKGSWNQTSYQEEEK